MFRLPLLRVAAVWLSATLLAFAAQAEAPSPLPPVAPAATAPAALVGMCQELEVDIVPFVYATDFSLSVNELSDMLEAGKAFGWGRGNHGLGLVRAERSVQAWTQEHDNGCRRFRMQAGYIGATLYVAREFAEGTCAFRHIAEHEEGHVAVYRHFLAYELPLLLATARQSILAEVAGLDTVTAAAVARMRVDDLLKRVGTAHDHHDREPESSRTCNGYIHRTVQGL